MLNMMQGPLLVRRRAAALSGQPIAVAPFATKIGTGNYDIPANLGGRTPKAALLFLNNSGSDAGDSSAGFNQVVGSSILGPVEWSVGTYIQDNAGTSNTAGKCDSNECLVDAQRTFAAHRSAFGVDKTTLVFDIADTVPARGFSVMFADDGDGKLQVASGVMTLNTDGSAKVVSGLGFQPDLIIFGGGVNPFDSLTTTGPIFALGMKTAGEQKAVSFGPRGNGIATQEMRGNIWSNKCFGLVSAVSGAQLMTATATITSDGFSVTQTGTTANPIGWTAIKFAGKSFKLVDFQTPTATGNQAFTGVGFKPSFVLGVITSQTVRDVTTTVASNANYAGIGFFSFDANGDQRSVAGMGWDDGLTDARSTQGPFAMIVPTSANPNTGKATLVSLDNDGFTLNYSQIGGAARYGFYLAIS